MTTPAQSVEIPCCSPATTESVAVVRDKVADTRADILVGQGAILKAQCDYASAVNANTDRGIYASMSQTDKYGLANLNATHTEAASLGAQVDRAEDNLGRDTNNSFARLSAQGESGFYRTREAIGTVDKDIFKSEISLGKDIGAGFASSNLYAANNYARLSEQNCGIKETVAAYGNRSSDQHAALARDICGLGKEVTLQAATHYGSIQLEASKNTAAIQLQAALNHKESLLEQSKWFALAEKTAMVNKCELEAKLAACCCEIKEVVVGTANATQDLIQKVDTTRIRDSLAATATENAILKLRREEHRHYPYPVYRSRSRRGSHSSRD